MSSSLSNSDSGSDSVAQSAKSPTEKHQPQGGWVYVDEKGLSKVERRLAFHKNEDERYPWVSTSTIKKIEPLGYHGHHSQNTHVILKGKIVFWSDGANGKVPKDRMAMRKELRGKEELKNRRIAHAIVLRKLLDKMRLKAKVELHRQLVEEGMAWESDQDRSESESDSESEGEEDSDNESNDSITSTTPPSTPKSPRTPVKIGRIEITLNSVVGKGQQFDVAPFQHYRAQPETKECVFVDRHKRLSPETRDRMLERKDIFWDVNATKSFGRLTRKCAAEGDVTKRVDKEGLDLSLRIEIKVAGEEEQAAVCAPTQLFGGKDDRGIWIQVEDDDVFM